MRLRILALLASGQLASCGVVIPDVRDLRVVSLRSVDLRLERDLSGRLRTHPVPGAAIELTTSADLASYMPRHAASVLAQASLCTAGALDTGRLLASYSPDAGAPVPDARPLPATRDPARRPLTVLLWLRREEEWRFETPGRTERFIAYDLLREPQDICLRLRGGSMLGGTWSSNTVRITADELRAALAAPPAAAAPGR